MKRQSTTNKLALAFSVLLLTVTFVPSICAQNATTAQTQTTASTTAAPARRLVVIEERVKPEMWDEYLTFLRNEAIPAPQPGGAEE